MPQLAGTVGIFFPIDEPSCCDATRFLKTGFSLIFVEHIAG
jgi:hypothetical protein